MHATIVRIGHIGIVVADLDRAVDFYTRVVGLSLTERFEYPPEAVGHGVTVAAGAFVRCDSTHHCISIFTLKDGDQSDGGGGIGEQRFGLHHVAFEVATPEELLAKYRELRDLGVPIVNARHGGPGNQPRFYIHDPDGNLLEFYWGIDHIGWEGRPREYSAIEEVDLEEFDFEGFVAERDRAALARN
jgi:catechol 2,3-dioxygenase-like lactoylglutathione lyase family enzyme